MAFERELKARVVVGGKGAAITAEDIFNVAAKSACLEIDKIHTEKLSLAKVDTEQPNSLNGDLNQQPSLTTEQSKATLVALIIEILLRQPKYNPDLVSALVSSVNKGQTVRLPINLANGTDFHINEEVLKVFSSVTKEEDGKRLKESRAATVGISAISLYSGKSLLAIADSVVALTCDAVQAITTSFDSENSGHKGPTEVASDLKTLLAGSTLVNPRKGGTSLNGINSVVQTHGSARESFKNALSAVRIELNGGLEGSEGSSEGSGASAGADILVNLVYVALQTLFPILARSKDRVNFLFSQIEKLKASKSPLFPQNIWESAQGMVSKVQDLVQKVKKGFADVALLLAEASGESEPVLPGVTVSLELSLAVEITRKVLSLEALLSFVLIGVKEAELAARVGGVKDGGKSTQKEGEKGGDKGGKEGKKGKKGGGFQLGKGSLILRNFVGNFEADLEEKGLEIVLESVLEALNPKSGAFGPLLADLRGVIEGNEARRIPKIPKGTRDFLPEQMAVREKVFRTVTEVFKKHGGVEIDTPVFELRETLMGKYGEDSKLIYDLADQGGEVLSLRYDLTVPFARYLAMHPVGNIRRYHIGKVYRRDNPQMKRGRFREFYQCDFDIAGQYPPMIADSEILAVLTEILDRLALGPYEIKLNHRGLLDGLLDICGVPPGKFRAICSAIDKLDKEPWEAVRTEMIAEKGLPPSVADKIGTFVVLRGEPNALLSKLTSPDSPFAGHEGSSQALNELGLLFNYLEALGSLGRIVLDLSLARGLDYYTGVIFEAVFTGGGVGVGSIAAGGRYDHLVGMFSGKAVPSVGVSVGVERVFTILMEGAQAEGKVLRSTHTEVLVASIGPEMLAERMKLSKKLWDAGIKTEYLFAVAPNMQRQLEYANKTGIPWMVLFGADELERGSVKVKDLEKRTEEEVKMEVLSELLLNKLGR